MMVFKTSDKFDLICVYISNQIKQTDFISLNCAVASRFVRCKQNAPVHDVCAALESDDVETTCIYVRFGYVVVTTLTAASM